MREVYTHFNASPTRKPANFASHGFIGDGDRDLTSWMAKNLDLAVWEKPDVSEFGLEQIETQLIRHWDPPINIDNAPTSRHHLKALRALLAREAQERAKTNETFGA